MARMRMESLRAEVKASWVSLAIEICYLCNQSFIINDFQWWPRIVLAKHLRQRRTETAMCKWRLGFVSRIGYCGGMVKPMNMQLAKMQLGSLVLMQLEKLGFNVI